ncbi:hypothetical protein [Streptomyces sp. NPDC001930]|uniref:hypothetical protein n=1 Tax=Streptomyces sp. NPDC001930 TaxID=3364625 RepID=UPI0036C46FF2
MDPHSEQLEGVRVRLGTWRFDSEEDCIRALDEIDTALADEVRELPGGEVWAPSADVTWDAVLAAAGAWVGLINYAVLSTYGPQSPMRFPGWAASVVHRLIAMCGRLRGPLRWAAQRASALDYSVGIDFPAGVQVSFSWSP